MSRDKLVIFDTTLRDGEQTPGVNLRPSEKIELAIQLERLRVDVIEVGFAAASRGDFEAIAAVSGAVRESGVASLTRALKRDVELSAQALKSAARPRIHVFIATSPLHMRYKLRMTPDEVYERAVESVAYARSMCGDVEFSFEDGSRTELDFLYRLCEGVINAGARTVNFPDTVGYSAVEEYAKLIADVLGNVINIDKAIVSAHCHNDLGLGVANTLAAIRAGARQAELTINGLGERAGNAALEEVVMGLSTRAEYYRVAHSIDTRQLYRTSRLTESLTGVPLPANKAVLGRNAFVHESGIHQHGVLVNRETYEIMKPETLGVPQRGLSLGKLSGRHAFEERLRQLGYALGEADVSEAFRKFKELADRKKQVTDRDLEALASHGLREIPQIYRLDSYQLFAGNKLTATATLTLSREDAAHTEAAVGDGPVDACFNAVNRVAGFAPELESYGIEAVTEGTDALGEVTVRLSHEGNNYLGKGVSTDVVEASILAYIEAINRIISEI